MADLLCSTPAQISFRSPSLFNLDLSASYSPISLTRTLMASFPTNPTKHNPQPDDDNDDDDDPHPHGSSGGKSWRSVGSTVLSIGKKAAIAGAAVTSAPVVIPPVLLFSAVGFAFALPFSVLFAGVACTDWVMSSLLSHTPTVGPQAPPLQRGEEEEEVDDVSNLSSCYGSAVEDQLWDAEKEAAPVTADDDQGLYSEEKIWEQISAIRTIVGYKAVPRSSYIEELRALYVFTGVEPPLSSKDISDLRGISEKLWCLKSIVGIK